MHDYARGTSNQWVIFRALIVARPRSGRVSGGNVSGALTQRAILSGHATLQGQEDTRPGT